MIKFFRKSRLNFLTERKTGKYSKNAIGEIILVVIGILIAIQVSNWNEDKKFNNKTESLFDKFEDDLISKIKSADQDISNSIIIDSSMKRTLANKLTRQDYINNERLRNLTTVHFT